MANYDMRANGYDFIGRSDLHAMCTMAVSYARTGVRDMSAEGYSFTGNHKFGQWDSGEPRIILPRALVEMAFQTVQKGKLITHAEGKDYSCNTFYEALIMILARAIEDKVPTVCRPGRPWDSRARMRRCDY
jgi:hypothetical protein